MMSADPCATSPSGSPASGAAAATEDHQFKTDIRTLQLQATRDGDGNANNKKGVPLSAHESLLPPAKKAKMMPSAKKSSPLQMDTLGVSVFHLKHVFMEEAVFAAKDASTGNPLSPSSKIYEIENLRGPPGVIRSKGTNTVCPIDGRLGAAYVHCLEGEDQVGEATHMLSYSWNYTIGDIVDTLSDFCHQHKLDPKRTYIWICCLCVNQHRVAENTTQDVSGMIAHSTQVDFFAIFGERVKKIGHLLVMMAPWNAPVYITRVWCIFEIFTAHTTDGCKLDIVMPPKEKHSLEQDVINNKGGTNALYRTLGKTKVQDAKASVESDRRAILHKVASDAGYQALNNQVNNLLRGWMHGVLTHFVEARENTNDEDYVDFCNQIGIIFERNGEHEASMKLHKAALAICETILDENHPKTATTCNNIGLVMMKMGDLKGALLEYKKGLRVLESVTRKDHPSVATIYNNIGCVLESMGDYEGALAKYNQAIASRLLVFGEGHPVTASSYNNIGCVLEKMGDYEGSLSKHKQALAIEEFVFGKSHPKVATSYNNIGSVLDKMGDYEGALINHKKALAVRLSVSGKDHPDTARSHNHIGCVLEAMGDYRGALSMLKEALAKRISALGKNHPSVATTNNNIGSVLYHMGDYDAALVRFEECLAIREHILGRDHPYTKSCLKWIEETRAQMKIRETLF